MDIQERKGAEVFLMDEGWYPVARERRRRKILLPAVLFAATVVTTVIAGALYEGVNPLADPYGLIRGVPFSASLLLILGSHELGHYFASKRHGVSATLPLFIPGPPIPPMIGTFGAVIKMRSPITTKRALVDIGAAGPLSGFVVAVMVTAVGLEYSRVMPAPTEGLSIGLGSSLIFRLLSYAVIGPVPEGYDIFLHPVAFAGWIGFFVTAMNLLPIGQLDGGHIVYALIGPFHRHFSMLMVSALIVLGVFTWQGWFVWAILVTILGVWHPPVENPYQPVDGMRRFLSFATLIVFILTFIPTPFYIFQS